MVCDFNFLNLSNSKKSISFREKLKDMGINPDLFDKKINCYNKEHFINAVKAVCKINDWDENDAIEITCCCSKYQYDGGNLYTIYDIDHYASARSLDYCGNECELCSGIEVPNLRKQ